MKKILIISPHFPPSNLTAVHRARIFANHLPAFNWEPIVLTVHEDYYEEHLDRNLEKLLPEGLRIEKVKAWKVGRPRLIGDVGIRGFRSLGKRAIEIIQKESIDFLYIPIPSFYAALLGRWVHEKTGVPYGIDYIDPWVHWFPGSRHRFSRHWWATKVADVLEPIAVKKASLITGVAESYYAGVLERNPKLLQQTLQVAIPFGIEGNDLVKLRQLQLKPYLFTATTKIKLVYAGAMLPKAYAPLRKVFAAIQKNKMAFSNLEIYFIGSGKSPNDNEGFNIKPIAQEFGIWEEVIFEVPQRIPYMDVLVHLAAANGVFILGSTEAHYTPSKVYQAIMTENPVFAVLHRESTAVTIINEGGKGEILEINGEDDLEIIETEFADRWVKFQELLRTFHPGMINKKVFEHYSAKTVTEQLVNALNSITS